MTTAVLAVEGKAAAAGTPELLRGGRYELLEVLGSGAMGTVYRARHRPLGCDVAIKLIHPHLADSVTCVNALLGEARAAARITHPNVARTLDFGSAPGGRCFIVMELLSGYSLAQILEHTPQPPVNWTQSIMTQVLAAMGAAHDSGIVHRDIKPDNVVIGRTTDDHGRITDQVKICDFGVARSSDVSSYHDDGRPTTLIDGVCGTPGYMAPEQANARGSDERSDVYAAGAMFYEMVTGRVPFGAKSFLEFAAAQADGLLIPPSDLRPGLDPDIERIILRALSLHPADRYPAARAMRADLGACLVMQGQDAFLDPSGDDRPRQDAHADEAAQGRAACADLVARRRPVSEEYDEQTLWSVAPPKPRARPAFAAACGGLFGAAMLYAWLTLPLEPMVQTALRMLGH